MRLPCRTAAATMMLFVLSLRAGSDAWAQRRSLLGAGSVEAGLRAGRDFENHAWSVGAQIRVPLGRTLEFRPSGDVFFPKEGKTGHQLNADGAIRFGDGGFYAGGGLAFVDLAESGGKQRGHNLFFGFSDQPGGTVTPFAEFRWTFYNETSPFRLAVGFNCALANLLR